ncbi:hypothetical protein ES705_19943 [subsurface metagenome]
MEFLVGLVVGIVGTFAGSIIALVFRVVKRENQLNDPSGTIVYRNGRLLKNA